jgi:trans-aconitate methyltransferase
MPSKANADADRAARSELKRILGLPFLPPALATRAAVRLRDWLRAAPRAMAPPPVHILESVLSLYDNRALGLLVELRVPERLDRPMSTDELAAACDADPDALDRLLHFAASRGFVQARRDGRFAPNATSIALRPGEGSWRAWVEFLSSDWFWSACRATDRAFSPDDPVPGIVGATGHEFFTYVNDVNPEAGAGFNAAMEAGATLQTLALVTSLDWTGVGSVCDVGGGTGATSQLLLRHLPGLDVTLFDLPSVVAEARSTLIEGPLADRCSIVGGSFFEWVPAGCDRYLLLAIVHDWADDKAVAILRNVRAALSGDARALVVETTLPERGHDAFAAASDLLMLTLADGRERTAAQHQALFAEAGLNLHATHQLPTGFVAYELGG